MLPRASIQALRRSSFWIACLLFSLPLAPRETRAQTPPALHTINVFNIPLAEALEVLIAQTDVNLVFASDLVAGKTTSCQRTAAPIEDLLGCLLEKTGLDFHRLSSGTYVLVVDTRAPARYGAISGQVVDALTGEPLPDAHVLFADASGGAVTNQAGRFVFSRLPPGNYPLSVSYVGYRHTIDTLTVSAGAPTPIKIQLEQEAVLTAPIVVTDMNWRLPSETLRETERPADSFSSTLASGTDLFRGLNTIIGVRVGDALADVHVQGGEAGDHSYVLDGVPIFIPIPNGGLVGPFSPFALSRLTVRKAGYGVRHGSNLAGVIEAEHALGSGPTSLTFQADALSVNGRWAGARNLGEDIHARWMLAGRQSIWSLYHPNAIASHFKAWSTPDLFLLDTITPASLIEPSPAGGHKNPFYLVPDSTLARLSSGQRQQDVFNFGDLHGAARIAFSPTQSLYASLYGGTNRFGNVDAVSRVGETAGGSSAPLRFESNYDWGNAMGQMRYETVLSRAALASVSGWSSRFRLSQYVERNVPYQGSVLDTNRVFVPDFDHEKGAFPGAGEWSRQATRDLNTIQEIGLRAEITYSAGSHHLLTAGLESRFSSSAFSLQLPGARGPNPVTAGRAFIQSEHRRASLYAEDQVSLSHRTHADLGIRLTHLGTTSAVYAEPRVALRHDAARGLLGPWAFRAAAGIFRQFVNQFDVAAIDQNAVLPYMRFWLPISGDVRPPLAYHVTASWLVMPAPHWQVRLESYYKKQPHQLTIDYAGLAGKTATSAYWSRQQDILTSARGLAYGAAVSIEKKTDRLAASAGYEYSVARQQIDNRFDGAWLPAAWNVPHRITAAVDATLGAGWTATLRWQGGIGRLWAFRSAYYNYLEPSEAGGVFDPFDLGDPTAHQLPMSNRLDAGVAYARPFGQTAVQVRLSLANLLSATQVDEWSLVYDADREAYSIVERPLIPFLPTLTARISF